MGDGENTIPVGLSLIIQKTNTNMYTNLYLLNFEKLPKFWHWISSTHPFQNAFIKYEK